MENNNIHVHAFTETVIPPTCKEKGYTLHKCECGYEHKDNFQPIASHNYETIEDTKPDCINGGSKQMHCTVCGETINPTFPPLGHDWGQWNISEFATCTEEGKQTRFCGRCGESETQAIKPTGHKFAKSEAKKVDGYVEHFCENCGETVKVPTCSTKIKELIKLHKSIVIIPCIVAVITALVVLSFKVFVPAYHYSKANKLIEQGNHAEAYSHLTECIDFKDTKAKINNFTFKHCVTSIEYSGNDSIQDLFDLFDTSTSTTYDENGNVISISDYKGETKYLYNEDKITLETKYDLKGKLTSKTEYTYNQNGGIEFKIECDSSGSSLSKTEYLYDENGNNVQINVYDKNDTKPSRTEMTYDENNNMIKSVKYTKGGRTQSITENRYNKSGTITQSTVTDYNLNSIDAISDKTVKKFNKNGIVISSTTYDENDLIEKKENYEYDEFDNIIKTTVCDGNNNKRCVVETSYEYHANEYVVINSASDYYSNYEYEYKLIYSDPINYSE